MRSPRNPSGHAMSLNESTTASALDDNMPVCGSKLTSRTTGSSLSALDTASRRPDGSTPSQWGCTSGAKISRDVSTGFDGSDTSSAISAFEAGTVWIQYFPTTTGTAQLAPGNAALKFTRGSASSPVTW